MLKKIFIILGLFMCTAVVSYAADNYINLEELDIQSNTQMTQAQYKRAQKIIRDLQNETPKQFNHNYGPFWLQYMMIKAILLQRRKIV